MNRTISILVCVAVAAVWATPAAGDPLPGQILKFQQDPMNGTPISQSGITQKYWGHDELSTAWLRYVTDLDGSVRPFAYKGAFMADDFADRFDQPVVHVRWWGSYINNEIIQPVNKFLIAFESDVPAVPGAVSFSRPGQVLLSQVVRKGPLAPGSGTYTENRITVATPGGATEDLYEYNAELRLPFPERPHEVYWLKVVALVDVEPGVEPETAPVTQWGWHSRDWTKQDLLASTPADGVVPGEHIEGHLNGDNTLPVWHFQDDSVQGDIVISLPIDSANTAINQLEDTFVPQNYVDILDGPDGISQFSKDLAFELYTIPEPATMTLLALGGATALLRRRRR